MNDTGLKLTTHGNHERLDGLARRFPGQLEVKSRSSFENGLPRFPQGIAWFSRVASTSPLRRSHSLVLQSIGSLINQRMDLPSHS